MPRFEASVIIERPVEEVFQFITRPENFAIWQAGMTSNSADDDGPPRVGATGRGTSKVLGRTFDFRWVVLEFEPSHHVSVGLQLVDREGTIEWTCEPVEAGTRFTITNDSGDTPPSSLFGKLGATLVVGVFQRRV